MSSKDRILKRLRDTKPEKENIALPMMIDEQIFADFPSSGDTLLSCFEKRFIELKGEIHYVSNTIEAADKILQILNTVSEKKCLIQKSPFLQEVCGKNELLFRYVAKDLGMDSRAFAQYEVGVTEADMLVARTGSILISSISGGGRRLSVLPPIHMVIAKEGQIVSSLEQAFQNLSNNKEYGSYATIISGPSRTSDIEKQLVLGAHGPKRLILILIRHNS